MNTSSLSNLSRRHFISASLGASALILAPRRLFAEETGIVPTMIQRSISFLQIRRYRGCRDGFERVYWTGTTSPGATLPTPCDQATGAAKLAIRSNREIFGECMKPPRRSTQALFGYK